jgi:hypothetical protein
MQNIVPCVLDIEKSERPEAIEQSLMEIYRQEEESNSLNPQSSNVQR